MSVYNGADYLDEAIESILAQTFRDFDFIIVDDGSTDGSLAILQRHARNDPRIRLISRPNKGLAASLNEAAAAAGDSPLLARMDSDDIALPQRLELQVAAMRSDPELLALGANIEYIDQDGRPLLTSRQPLDTAGIDDYQFRSMMAGMFHPTVVMRAEAFHAVGGYRADLRQSQDIDLWLRMSEIGRLGNLPDVLLRYRQHVDSVGFRSTLPQRQTAWRALAEAAERRGRPFDKPCPEAQETGPADPLRELYRRWGWWAYLSGNLGTARHYARRIALGGLPTLRDLKLLALSHLGWLRR